MSIVYILGALAQRAARRARAGSFFQLYQDRQQSYS